MSVNIVQGKSSSQMTKKYKDFLTLDDFNSKDIYELLDQAMEMKNQQKNGIPHPFLKGKVLGMVFEKSSTRTRVSFEVGMKQLGGDAIFLNANDLQLGRGESIEDTAKVLSRYVDGIMIRTFEHTTIEEFAQHADVPVINGLTDMHHPTQVLADLLTIYEYKGNLSNLKMCFIGDGHNNMCHSLLEGAACVGMDLSIATPEGYQPAEEIFETAKQKALGKGGQITYTTSPKEAVDQADVIVTDVWSSMGQEGEAKQRFEAFRSYRVNASICETAKEDFIFLHCLPAHREEEVTSEIIDGPNSVVYDEAENRLHAQKAILKNLL